MVIVGSRLELMNSESLLAQFDALLPLAVAWATEEGLRILREGHYSWNLNLPTQTRSV
jgi:hypothetical protein